MKTYKIESVSGYEPYQVWYEDNLENPKGPINFEFKVTVLNPETNEEKQI